MNKIYVTIRDLELMLEFMKTMQTEVTEGTEDTPVPCATIMQDGSSGIGSITTITLPIQHKDFHGEFTVTISDENDW